MKKNNTLALLLILSFSGISFAAQEAANTDFTKELTTLEKEFDFSAGHRRDSFDWNIAGDMNGQNPNILSELKWKDLSIFQVNAGAKLTFDKKARIEGSYGYGWIYDGDNQDSDYLGDDRTWEFSRSNNKAEGDNVSNWSVGLGYQFNLDKISDYLVCESAAITLLGGYSQHNQNLIMTDGSQTIPDTGSFAGLDSTYETEWKGPWLGVELEGTKGKITGFFRYEHHWADYHADANWNLRDDFAHPVSFSHDADGKGDLITVGTGYNISNSWLMYIKADIQMWKADAGVDRTFLSDGTSSDTRLNQVNWKSTAILLGLKFRI